jgi:hypothetical protein
MVWLLYELKRRENELDKNQPGSIQEAVGKVLYLGKANEKLNGEETWDFVMLVQYPSGKAFIRMINNPRNVLKCMSIAKEPWNWLSFYATDPVRCKDLVEK